MRDTAFLCKVPDCGRPVRARGLCQSHHKQDCKFGQVWELERRQPRRKGTVRLSGLSVTREAADKVRRVASERGFTPNHLITDILEDWAKRKHRALQRKGRAARNK
jgi:hypothetical protein